MIKHSANNSSWNCYTQTLYLTVLVIILQRNGVRCKAGSCVRISDTDIYHCGLDQDDEVDGKENQEDDDNAAITKDTLMAGISVEVNITKCPHFQTDFLL